MIVLSLAFEIGANSAIFSVVDALLLRPLPYPEPERLAALWLHTPGIGIFRDWPSPGEYVDLRNENHSFHGWRAGRRSRPCNLKWSLYIVRTMNPGNIPRFEDIGINGAVLAFTLGVSLATGILFGLASAWRAIQVDLMASLKSGGIRGQGNTGLRISRHRLRGLLVVSELALPGTFLRPSHHR